MIYILLSVFEEAGAAFLAAIAAFDRQGYQKKTIEATTGGFLKCC